MSDRFVISRVLASSVARGLVLSAAVMLLAGCSNPFSPGASNAGVYKGAPDSLGTADERASALKDRFELIQKR